MRIKELLDKIPIPPLKECGTILENKWYRLKSYYHLLEISEPTHNAEKTLELINDTLIKIEDCHSGIEKQSNPGLKYKGRMYPIQDDFIDRRKNGSIVALSKGNRILIEPTGEFTILSRINEEIILEKRYGN